MKKSTQVMAAFIFILSLSFISCVPSKKLADSEDQANALSAKNSNLQSQLNDCNEKVKNVMERNVTLKSENDTMLSEMKVLSTASKMTIAEQAKRLKYFQDMIQSQQELMIKLKNSITDALLNYKTDEINVIFKDGKVYVSMEEKLLFKSGSDVVDKKGKEALGTLAKVLNGTSDIIVMIEGHTDNVPIKTSQFKDNWDLSTARATAILRILTRDYFLDSNRVTASGRGQFHPVATNDTPAGRAANRRTEIILSPDLKEMFKLLLR